MTRVLVIDDDASVRNVLRRMLEQEGYDVAEAATGDDGLAYCEWAVPDVVITDLFMPNTGGLEVIRKIAAGYPGTKTIAVTGCALGSKEDLAAVAREQGASEVLLKPVDQDDLLGAIGAHEPSANSGGEVGQ